MKIQLLEFAPVWMNAPESCRLAERMACDGVDLIVLPEMFATGFALDKQSADSAFETLEWMKHLAHVKNSAVAGTMVVLEDGKFFNRLYFVRPDGEFDHYDKRHLFTYAGENKVFSAGKKRVITQWQGIRILLQTCYDLRFPVFSRNRGDYDMVLYCASWPESRIGAWDILLRARAIENICYVAAVNRTGNDPSTTYNGHSALLDFTGNQTNEVDITKLRNFREKFPALEDADEFSII